MRDFDPHRIASEWHSGQGSALYAYMSTDRIPTEDFKDRLVTEIERAMAHADDDGLDELEYLLMHVEESHPDQYPNDEMHESIAVGDDEECECGRMKSEGCGCAMAESEDLDEIELGWLKQAASKVKDIAMTDVGGPEGFLSPSDRASKHGKTDKGGESEEYAAWKQQHANKKTESVLRQAIARIISEMKLGISARFPFHFGGATEVDADSVDHFLLSKDKKSPEAPESGVKVKSKSAPKNKRAQKSKKAS